MTVSTVALFVAHPGHELVLHGWLRRTSPVVHVLTDGSGHSLAPRIAHTAALLREAGAHRGSIFGRLSDREAYALILERNVPLLVSLAGELATQLKEQRATAIVCDAAEGYNPVHDLCRLIVGAAISAARLDIKQCEYAVAGSPDSFDAVVDDVTYLDLDDTEFEAKVRAARTYAAVLNDVDTITARHGLDAYRREVFRNVADWTDLGASVEPDYERFGAQRVAAGKYERVIRRAEHFALLRDALCAWVETAPCVS